MKQKYEYQSPRLEISNFVSEQTFLATSNTINLLPGDDMDTNFYGDEFLG